MEKKCGRPVIILLKKVVLCITLSPTETAPLSTHELHADGCDRNFRRVVKTNISEVVFREIDTIRYK